MDLLVVKRHGECTSELWHHVLSGRLDILVHAKQVLRVVLSLHLGEAIEVRAVGSAPAIALIGGEEIDVDAGCKPGSGQAKRDLKDGEGNVRLFGTAWGLDRRLRFRIAWPARPLRWE